MKTLLYIFIGGGLGSVFRYLISSFSHFQKTLFPWPTLIANTIGCLLIGLLWGWATKQQLLRSDAYFFAAVGFCGGLTTFSTLSLEGIQLLKPGNHLLFFMYLISSFAGGLLCIMIGHYTIKSFF